MATWTQIATYSNSIYISGTGGVELIPETSFTIPSGYKGCFIRCDMTFPASGYRAQFACAPTGDNTYAQASYYNTPDMAGNNTNGQGTALMFVYNNTGGKIWARGYYGNYYGSGSAGTYTYTLKVYQLNIPETTISADLVRIATRMTNASSTLPAQNAVITRSPWVNISSKLGNTVTIDTTKPLNTNLNSILSLLQTYRVESGNHLMYYIKTSDLPT